MYQLNGRIICAQLEDERVFVFLIPRKSVRKY